MSKFNHKAIKEELRAIISKETKESLQSFLDEIKQEEEKEKLKLEKEKVFIDVINKSVDFFRSQNILNNQIKFELNSNVKNKCISKSPILCNYSSFGLLRNPNNRSNHTSFNPLFALKWSNPIGVSLKKCISLLDKLKIAA